MRNKRHTFHLGLKIAEYGKEKCKIIQATILK